MQLNKALFLDRDGVINIDHGYTYKIKDFTFIDGIFDLVKEAIKKDYLIIIVTNQSGIGRGYYTLNDFETLTDWMLTEFEKNEAKVTKVYYCPHHVEAILEEFRIECNCRKPKPGMINLAIQEFNINPEKSLLIGDKETDIEAAKQANINNTILFGKPDNSSAKNILFDHYKIISLL